MKSAKLWCKVIAVAMITALTLSGCGGGNDKILIGAIGPTTGESSIGGQDELEGKQMAVEDFNAAGGLNGKMVELVAEDDASQPSQAAAAAMKLINQNKVVAIVGAHNSACTLAVMEVLDKSGVPMITPGSSAASIVASGNKWIARSFPGDIIQAGALVNYAKDTMGVKKIGVIYVNDDFGQGGMNVLTAACEKNGIEIVSESFQGEDKDMKPQLTKLKNADIDGLFIWCQYFPGSLIMKQSREMGWDVQFYGSTGIIHNDTISLSSGAYAGTINSVPFIPNSPEPKVKEWVERYQAKFGDIPSQNSARAYDATMILLNAMKTAGSTDEEKVREAMRNTVDYDGLQGKISIDPNTGEYIGEVMIVKPLEDGSFEYLGSSAST